MRLENWWFFEDDGDILAYGTVYGSANHADGKLISTSRITGVVSKAPLIISTQSGSQYELVKSDLDGHPACIRSGCRRLGIKL